MILHAFVDVCVLCVCIIGHGCDYTTKDGDRISCDKRLILEKNNAGKCYQYCNQYKEKIYENKLIISIYTESDICKQGENGIEM